MAALGVLAAGFAPLAGFAADAPPPDAAPPADAVSPLPQMLDWEIRGGVYAHDPESPERGSVDINAELVGPKLWSSTDPFWSIFIPRPDFGTSVSVAGKTSNLWGGAAWNYDITKRIFISSTFGVGVNDGKTGPVIPPGWNGVGCNWWFHESESLGYRLTDNWSVMATIEHSSNANLCRENRGLTNAGLRLGYRF
jgi:lipid A 3-O-deacylase